MEIPKNLSEQESQVTDTLRVDEDQLNSTEKETRKQAECTKWRDERSFRFTVSFQNGREIMRTLPIHF